MSKKHLGKNYRLSNDGIYTVFLETNSDKKYDEKEVTLVIKFRLKFIGENIFFHWLFQHLCVLDTPLWVGFKGFKTKYWMVEPKTKDYLGLYRYQGKENAKRYAEYICSVLRPFSSPNSIWYMIENETFNSYTKSRIVSVT